MIVSTDTENICGLCELYLDYNYQNPESFVGFLQTQPGFSWRCKKPHCFKAEGAWKWSREVQEICRGANCCWWLKSGDQLNSPVEGTHQLKAPENWWLEVDMVVYPIIYRVLVRSYTSKRWLFGISEPLTGWTLTKKDPGCECCKGWNPTQLYSYTGMIISHYTHFNESNTIMECHREVEQYAHFTIWSPWCFFCVVGVFFESTKWGKLEAFRNTSPEGLTSNLLYGYFSILTPLKTNMT